MIDIFRFDVVRILCDTIVDAVDGLDEFLILHLVSGVALAKAG